jgi:hypothetical protein
MKQWITITFVLSLFAGIVYPDNTPDFKGQVIRVPMNTADWPRVYWKDINQDGLTDILALVQRDEKVFIYIQNSSGIPSLPTQSIRFPEGTAWFAVYDVSEHPGRELLISTTEGLSYYRQNNGIVETKPEKLIEAKQVIPQNHPPIVKEPDKWPGDLKNTIPVVFSGHTIIYKCDEDYQLTQCKKIEHEFKKSIEKYTWNSWSLGPKKSDQLRIRTTADEKPKDEEEKDSTLENEYIEKTIEKIKKDNSWWAEYGIERQDIDDDSDEDLVLWRISGAIFDIKTSVMVFLRNENGKLPEKPNQILRCQGMPLDVSYRNRQTSVLTDVNNDGLMDILLLDLKAKPMSASSFVEAVVSKGMEWVLTVRLFKRQKGYRNRADFKMDFTSMLPMAYGASGPVTFDGDFNADGRKDLIVRRAPTQCNIYLSSSTSGFYDRQPKIQLVIPAEGRMFVQDLNNDSISDIYLINYEKGEITVFLSKSLNRKGASQ